MINFAISIVAGIAALVLFNLILGGIWYAILPAVVIFVGVYFVLMRRTLKQVEAIMLRAQADLARIQESAMKGRQRVTEQQLKEKMIQAIEVIKQAYQYNNWQFLVESQVNTQVGTLLFAVKEYDQAEPYLRNAFLANSMSQAMLAVIYFRKRQYEKMEEAFERSLKRTKKDSIVWGVFAWCLWKNKDRDGAIKILNRAKEHTTDERIEANLLALQNKEKMDMEPWGQAWYQFQLVKPNQQRMIKQLQPRQRGGKKALYR